MTIHSCNDSESFKISKIKSNKTDFSLECICSENTRIGDIFSNIFCLISSLFSDKCIKNFKINFNNDFIFEIAESLSPLSFPICKVSFTSLILLLLLYIFVFFLDFDLIIESLNLISFTVGKK